MIIDCIKCTKKFEVNASLIPDNGRTIQCGSCNHVWFYKPKLSNLKMKYLALNLMMISWKTKKMI
jgi:predicted Zn finger-like uncharacterized protein